MESRHPKRHHRQSAGWRAGLHRLWPGATAASPTAETTAFPLDVAANAPGKPHRHAWLVSLLLAMPFLVWGTQVFAKAKQIGPDFTSGLESNPITLIVILAGMSLMPFALMMVTSFVKIAVVLSIIRSALGTQQNPPTQVITGLAIILTVYVMVPVAMDVHSSVEPVLKKYSGSKKDTTKMAIELAKYGAAPVKEFLRRHSHPQERAMFFDLGVQMQETQALRRKLRLKKKGITERRAKKKPTKLGYDDFLVLVPSFVISELKEAFQIGFLIFLPFLVVDMVVANILLALGMHMLSPTTISLPFKLLLFVLVDGWYLLAKGLVLGYI